MGKTKPNTNIFSPEQFGKSLRMMRHLAGFSNTRSFSEAIKDCTGESINFEVLMRYERGECEPDLTNLIAISESTPGPIGVNAATYVGFLNNGLIGAIVATLGLIAPAIIVILIISRVLDKFQKSALVQSVFYGLRPASTALIASAGVIVVKNAFFLISATGISIQIPHLILGVVLLILVNKINLHPALYILIAAVVGIVFKL